MKKTWVLVVMVIIIGLVLAVSACKSKPEVKKTAEEAFQEVYDHYRKDLILDGAENYTVVSGDTLVGISRRFYTDKVAEGQNAGFYYPVIMLASSKTVLDPDKIAPGMELIIPDLEKNLADNNAKSSIKKFLGDIAGIEDDRERASTASGLRELANSL